MKRKKKKMPLGVRLIIVTVTILVIVCVAVQLLLPNGLFGDPSPDREGEAYVFESGSMQSFARVGDALAVATTSGMQLLDDEGYTVVHEIFAMSTPAVTAGDSSAAFYDVGGTALRVAFLNGKSVNLDINNTIISVNANKSGALAVVTEDTGNKACVTIYDSDLEAVFEWHSGTVRVLSAHVSADGKSMAALGVGEAGGSITIFSLMQEEPIATVSMPGELFFELRYLDNNTICAVSSSSLIFIDGKGEALGSYDFDGSNLADYAICEDYVVLLFGKYYSSVADELATVETDGSLRASIELENDAQGVSANDNRVLLICTDELVLYNTMLEEIDKKTGALGINSVILREKGDCLLLGSFMAELFAF